MLMQLCWSIGTDWLIEDSNTFSTEEEVLQG